MKKSEERKRVILGGREQAMLEVIADALREVGAEVEVVGSHRELLRRCRRREYRLIVTRFVAPLLDSPGEVRRLRGEGLRTRLFVLSHTHKSTISVMLLERGVNQFLSLPVHTQRLVRKVTSELNKYNTL